jgi:hypothetical protein
VDTLGGWRTKSVKNSNWLDLNKSTYFKEIFVDSETSMAILSGFPSYPPEENILIPVDHMAAARDEINQKAGSRRMLSHGLISPNMPRWREEATRQVQKLGPIPAWKLYTADGQGGKRGWWLDDEQVAYPLYKHSLELGSRISAFTKARCHGLERGVLSREGRREGGPRLATAQFHHLPLGLPAGGGHHRHKTDEAADQEPLRRSRKHVRADGGRRP